MGKVYYLTCPKCGFRYYVGHSLISLEGFPTVCPNCHHEYLPSQSATGVKSSA